MKKRKNNFYFNRVIRLQQKGKDEFYIINTNIYITCNKIFSKVGNIATSNWRRRTMFDCIEGTDIGKQMKILDKLNFQKHF